VTTSRGDSLQLEQTGDPAIVRITVGQKRAVIGVLSQASMYPTPDALAEAVAAAVVSAEDAKVKYAVVTTEPGAVWCFGPYASHATAAKTAASGHCATRPGARARVVPLIASPKSLAPVPKTGVKKSSASNRKAVN
jgi:hypothetical protein